jgi:rare lipoprotein A
MKGVRNERSRQNTAGDAGRHPLSLRDAVDGWSRGRSDSEEGVANFYSNRFEGKKTASGEVYHKGGLTAAHKKLAYGTKVKVTNVANGKSVVVTVNDRMNASNPAVIDVTRHAAEELGFAGSGRQSQTGGPEINRRGTLCRSIYSATSSVGRSSFP